MDVKILLLGKDGMAGQTVYRYLKEHNYDIKGLSRKEFNATEDKLCDKEQLEQYDYVINCIGLLNHETDTKKLILVNALLPHILEEYSKEYNFKLIHISTDCYLDNTAYGHSKWLGELNNSLTIRTSIIGHDNIKRGTGLLNWVINQQGVVNGYLNHIWYGITTLELAKVIDKCIELELTGIVEATNGTPITKNRLLELIKKEYELDIDIKGIYTEETTIKELQKDIDFNIPTYEQMIHEMRLFNEKH